uniref:Uncharacterized protein n=1 Tax=Erythrolobus australicus TaxID=1077150 RepID=A0A7S1TN45_9RHOD|mmetsp:Transcript_4884/g.13105  ORF Transcript_4884/g.13105 Transcript_4884/m.13105 type:complete len:477 (+) Transcript_4884:139-1569(+)
MKIARYTSEPQRAYLPIVCASIAFMAIIACSDAAVLPLRTLKHAHDSELARAKGSVANDISTESSQHAAQSPAMHSTEQKAGRTHSVQSAFEEAVIHGGSIKSRNTENMPQDESGNTLNAGRGDTEPEQNLRAATFATGSIEASTTSAGPNALVQNTDKAELAPNESTEHLEESGSQFRVYAAAPRGAELASALQQEDRRNADTANWQHSAKDALESDAHVTHLEPQPKSVDVMVALNSVKQSPKVAIAHGLRVAKVCRSFVTTQAQKTFEASKRAIRKVSEKQTEALLARLGYHTLDEVHRVQAHMGLGLGVGLVIASLILPGMLVHSSLSSLDLKPYGPLQDTVASTACASPTRRPESVAPTHNILERRQEAFTCTAGHDSSFPLAEELQLIVGSRQNSEGSSEPGARPEEGDLRDDLVAQSLSRTTSSLALDLDPGTEPGVIVCPMYGPSALYDSPKPYRARPLTVATFAPLQ